QTHARVFAADKSLEETQAQRIGQLTAGSREQLIEWPAGDVMGHEPATARSTKQHAPRDGAQFDRDIGAAAANADDEHRLPGKRLRRFVGAAMEARARKRFQAGI